RDRRRVRRHFVIFDFECRYVKGKLRAGSDALDAMWADEVRLKQSDILPIVRELGLLSLRRSRRRRGR
ncbi:MAG: hypothetical protein MUF51_09160, partial [Vicinamibacteria bacterium]|nr:hypothetical protein [Vicinamibacteria bacterium]